MKKSLILAAALPVLCIGAGYGYGVTLGASPAEAAKAETAEPEAVQDPVAALMDAAAQRAIPVTAHEGAGEAVVETLKPAEPEKTSKHVVKLGRMMVPVMKPQSVTYVVADFGVAMPDSDTAAHYRIAENAIRLRDSIMTSLKKAAEDPMMLRAALDSDWLSATITEDLRASFQEAQEVLFLSLYKKDVPRS